MHAQTQEALELLDGLESQEIDSYLNYFFNDLAQSPKLALKIIKRIRAQFVALDQFTQNQLKELELIAYSQIDVVGVV